VFLPTWKFGLGARVSRIIQRFPCFSSAHTVYTRNIIIIINRLCFSLDGNLAWLQEFFRAYRWFPPPKTTIIMMVFLFLYLPEGLDIFVLCSIFITLIYIHVCTSISRSCMQLKICCTEFRVCLYGFTCILVWISRVLTLIYIHICVVSIPFA
jgi:hypothetical protein